MVIQEELRDIRDFVHSFGHALFLDKNLAYFMSAEENEAAEDWRVNTRDAIARE